VSSLTIRLATPSDAEQIQAIYAPYCQTPISFELEAPAVEDMRGRIAKVLGPFPWLVCDDGGTIIGYAYASPHRERAAYCWSVDTTIYISQGQHRRGVGRALYASLLSILPLQGYVNAYAGITLPNPGSVGLHEAMGFTRVGVYKHVGFRCASWHDVVWFERLLQPLPATPSPPRDLEALLGTTEWAGALDSGMRLLAVAEGAR
jgi:L-amino acid N-acyltransferase YncA